MGCGQEPVSVPAPRPSAHLSRRVNWIGQGIWLKADTHTHTNYSDASHPLSEVADRARAEGCDVLAITDHTNQQYETATPEWFGALDAAQRAHPEMIVLAGLEWNVPPWGRAVHATVLVPPAPEAANRLAAFKDRFDDADRSDHDPALAGQALRWLEEQASVDGISPLVFINHPSRNARSSLDLVDAVRHWREINDVVVGFSGAPGYQRFNPLGAYRSSEKLIDRWDPAVARLGDAWDRLLGLGIDLWAARAPSDFHSARRRDRSDLWPGSFSETWIYAPERNASGVLRALRAGTFFAVHGHIVRQVIFTLAAAGLDRPAWPGEIVEVAQGMKVTVQVDFTVPNEDWEGQSNRIDRVELIGVTADGAKLLAERTPRTEAPAFEEAIEVPHGGIVLRVRGRRLIHGGPDLLFYTNPIRVQVSPGAPADP